MSLGTGANKLKVGRGPDAIQHSREVSMATLWAGTTPTSGLQLAPTHWKEFSGNTYLTWYLPKPTNQEGGSDGSQNSQWFALSNIALLICKLKISSLIHKDQLIDLQLSFIRKDQCKMQQEHNASHMYRTSCKVPDHDEASLQYAKGRNCWLHWLELNFA